MEKAYAPLTVVPGEEPPVKALIDIFVACIKGSQASLLVKALGQAAPLGTLDHLKRIRKHPNGEASQLQIILCAEDPPAALSRQENAGNSMQQASHTVANALSSLQSTVQACPNAELESSGNNHAECQLAASSAPEGLLVRSAEGNMVTQNVCSRSQAADDKQQERYASSLPDKVAAMVKQHQVKIEIVQVPKHAPASREQWQDWNRVWPISWRKPELTAVTAATAAARAVTLAEKHSIHLWMDRAYALAEVNANSGSVRNAAVIVDPVSGEVIAVGQDCTSRHPLKHALMVAIDNAAARDRELWPIKSKDTSTAGMSKSSCSQADAEAATPDSSTAAVHEISMPVKRRRTSAGNTADIALPAALGMCQPEAEQEAEVQVSQSAMAGSQPNVGAGTVAKSYLCTGFDCYVVQEPCAMCAMAATHARLRRICYSIADPQRGVLGGSHKLHGQDSLNHHYQVMHLPLVNP